MIYWQLFVSFFQIGLFSFGGGYAAVPLIQEQVIDTHHWLTLTEFTDLITISQMTPGPIAVNSATFIGIQVAGIPGAITATIASILPSLVIVTAIAYFYLKYRHLSALQDILSMLRPAVIALIATAGVSIFLTAIFGGEVTQWHQLRIHMIVIFLLCLRLLYKKANPVLVMFFAGILNVLYSIIGFYLF